MMQAVRGYNKYLEQKAGYILYNLGIPQMLLTSLTQYSKKTQKNLFESDLIIIDKSINQIFTDKEINYLDIKKWRAANKLTFFGMSQYEFMENYLKDFIL